jgi:ureidoglycolate hydrolase
MGQVTTRIEPVTLTEGAWAPFGWLPVADTDPADGSQRLAFEWADPHVNLIGHARAEVPEVPGGLRCEMLYRHDTHTQTVMSVDHPCVIAVAPAATNFSAEGGNGAVRAFVLQPLEPIVLGRGTWHWGPFPTRAETVRLFNVQGLRYAEDNTMVDLAALGLAVDVVVA